MERRGTLTNGAGALVLVLLTASCTAILGIDNDYRELRVGAGGADAGIGGAGASGSEATSAISASSSSTSSSGGATMAVWQSWDIQENLGKLFVYDTDGHNPASIVPYQSKSLTDLDVDIALSSFIPNVHPDGFNNVANYWVAAVGAKYPYVGQSAVPRGMDGGEINTPGPLGVIDLQLHPSPDANKLVVAAFVVPFTGNYMISSLAARRVNSNGDLAALRVFVGSAPAGPGMLVADKDRAWVYDAMTYPLGMLAMGTQINVAVDPVNDSNHDATEIAWIIIAQ